MGISAVTVRIPWYFRLLAESRGVKFGFKTGEILKEHARYIELMQQRVKELGVAVAERDGQIGAG